MILHHSNRWTLGMVRSPRFRTHVLEIDIMVAVGAMERGDAELTSTISLS